MKCVAAQDHRSAQTPPALIAAFPAIFSHRRSAEAPPLSRVRGHFQDEIANIFNRFKTGQRFRVQ
jgi:hypothetical protein